MRRLCFIPFLDKDTVILIKEKDHTGCLGGRPEKRETEVETVIREVLEETSGLIDLRDFYQEVSSSFTITFDKARYYFFNMNVNKRTIGRFSSQKFPENGEIDELQIWPIKTLIECLENSPSMFESYFYEVLREISSIRDRIT